MEWKGRIQFCTVEDSRIVPLCTMGATMPCAAFLLTVLQGPEVINAVAFYSFHIFFSFGRIHRYNIFAGGYIFMGYLKCYLIVQMCKYLWNYYNLLLAILRVQVLLSSPRVSLLPLKKQVELRKNCLKSHMMMGLTSA